jgi:large subunit ribosomal protein L1
MKQAGKHVENARKKVEARDYKLAEATELIKKTHHTKFNETVELAINLGVDPKHSDQSSRVATRFARHRKRARISLAAKIWLPRSSAAGRTMTP